MNPPEPLMPPDQPPDSQTTTQAPASCFLQPYIILGLGPSTRSLQPQLVLVPSNQVSLTTQQRLISTALDLLTINCELHLLKPKLNQNTYSPQISVTDAAALPGCQESRPPVRAPRYGNRDISSASGGPIHRRWLSLYHKTSKIPTRSFMPTCRQTAPAQSFAVDGDTLRRTRTAASPNLQGTKFQVWISLNVLGLTQVGLRLLKTLKPITHFQSAKPFSLEEVRQGQDAHTTKATRPPPALSPLLYTQPLNAIFFYADAAWQAMTLFTGFISSALMAEAFAFKAALDAASPLEFQHFIVYFDSQSLVSPNTNGDVNELKSVLVDIRCLLETFSSILCFMEFQQMFMLMCSPNLCLTSLLHDCTFA